jgi:cerevisin
MFVLELLYFASAVWSKNYILTLKDDMKSLSFGETSFVTEMSNEHNLELLADFSENLLFYKTSQENLFKYAKTLSKFFDIEEDKKISLNDMSLPFELKGVNVFNNSVPWNLDRITKRSLPLDGEYKYSERGSCHTNKDVEIHTYVIDTGIDVDHPEFEGRATWLANFVDSVDSDCQSHGTHCAGTIGSKTYGVCKDAKLFAVKVLGCDGSGSTSSVISGINYAFKRHLEENKKNDNKIRSIVSMSLGGGYSPALNKAVLATTKDSQFYFAAAAGNEDNDSCRVSPASVKEIFTVMASDKDDNRAWFSNYGKCADIYSPGVNIMSTVPNNKTAVYSGTSMATPGLVGVLNHYLNRYPNLNLAELKKKVLSDASKDTIVGNPQRTSNLFVYLNRDEA